MAAKKPPHVKRLGYMLKESFDYLSKHAKHHDENVKAYAIPSLADRNRRITYRARLNGNPRLEEMSEELRDILGRARSVLDNVMYALVESLNPNMTEAQKRAIDFPIVSDATKWSPMEKRLLKQHLSQTQIDDVKSFQPFVTGKKAIEWFDDIHNVDKHRTPLKVELVSDAEFVMLFQHIEPHSRVSHEHWIDWPNPLPPIRTGVRVVDYRVEKPVHKAGRETVPTAPAVWFDSQWHDVQNLLWDIMEFVARVTAVLDEQDTKLADSIRDYFDGERELLAAFRKMMLSGDPSDEERWLSLSRDLGYNPG